MTHSWCHGCRAEITWGKWPKTGKPMPAHRDANGLLVLVDGYWQHATGAPNEGERFTSHFATCTKADLFRKRDSAPGAGPAS
jgi:hypothetical protein